MTTRRIKVRAYTRRDGTPVRCHTRKIKKRIRKTIKLRRQGTGYVTDASDRATIIALNVEQRALDAAFDAGEITMEEYKKRSVAVQDSIYSFYDKYYPSSTFREMRHGLWDPVEGKLLHSFRHERKLRLKQHSGRQRRLYDQLDDILGMDVVVERASGEIETLTRPQVEYLIRKGEAIRIPTGLQEWRR